MKSGKSCVRDLLVTLTQPIPIEISSSSQYIYQSIVS